VTAHPIPQVVIGSILVVASRREINVVICAIQKLISAFEKTLTAMARAELWTYSLLSGTKRHSFLPLLFGDFLSHSQGLFDDIGGDSESVDLSDRLLQFTRIIPISGVVEHLI
jgi:hypothetical protein